MSVALYQYDILGCRQNKPQVCMFARNRGWKGQLHEISQ